MRIERENDHTLKRRLLNGEYTRPDKMLAHEHAEHRRLGRVFKPAGGEMYAGVARAGGDDKAKIAAPCAQGEKEHIPFGLLHPVYAPANCFLPEFARESADGHGIKRHRYPPLSS